ncbi:GTPase IMAP family member 8-like [Danio aesculapii]|uniref:GTPase IMAP family member 8-like n=1 Tax=Danio aesculapii TaxID=1142201 RepID=UPI0024BFCFB1|nr:GTPase IMAP family member 8-like [Danio aesculapii]
MASARNDSDEGTDVRIVLLGGCGAGKSSMGNAILGAEVFKESRTRESKIQRGRVEDRNISIIDTPGFFNTHLTAEELQNQMMKSLDLCFPGPHVFLLIINLENFTDDQKNIVKKILDNFGPQALKFTMVLFIGKEKFSRRSLTQIIDSEKTQKLLNSFEGRFSVINSKNECTTNQITQLLTSIDGMMASNGGQIYNNEIYMTNMRKHTMEKQEQFEVELKIMKPKEEKKGYVNMKKNQEERESLRVKVENQEEEVKNKRGEASLKDHSERRQEDVRKKTQYLGGKYTGVQEDLQKQMESRREKEKQRWELARDLASGNLPRQADLRIMILGKTDVGKTTTANTILGRDGLTSILTCEKHEAVVSGRNISIIDTPGLLDAPWYNYMPDERKRDIEESLEMSAPGPHVFLLVIKLNGRRSEEEKNTVKWIQENFGEDAVHHTLVLFTYVDLLRAESLDQYIRRSPDLQSLIDSCSGRFHAFNDQDRNNQKQVTELLEKIEQLVKDNSEQHYDRKNSHKMKNENNRETLESHLDELLRETGNLLGLMMGLQLSEVDIKVSLARAMAESNLSKQDLRIVLLGLVGSGKSSTGNTILGRDAFNVSLRSVTNSCENQAAVVCGKTISITDTPPIIREPPMWFFLQHRIEKSLEMSAPGPHVFLLLVDVQRFTEEKAKAVKWIQENVEKDALNHTIVLFTHTDLLKSQVTESLKVYIRLYDELKSLLESCGGRYQSFSNEETTNPFQVIQLLQKCDKLVEKNGGGLYTKQNIFKTDQTTHIRQNDDDKSCQIQ